MSFHEIMGGGYEKDVLTKLEDTSDPKHVFQNETNDLGYKVEGVKEASQQPSIEYLHSWVKAESREIAVLCIIVFRLILKKAFLQAIEQKDMYDVRRKKASDRWNSTLINWIRQCQERLELWECFH